MQKLCSSFFNQLRSAYGLHGVDFGRRVRDLDRPWQWPVRQVHWMRLKVGHTPYPVHRAMHLL